DSDHVGGLADFPAATVHLTGAEAFAAQHPQTFMEKQRYRPTYYAHGPALVEHTPAEGESWRGFPGAEELTDIAPGVVLISLPGHTRGHAAVAVDAGDRWVLHVGDAFYFRRQLDGRIRNPMTLMERSVAFDWAKVQANHQRLAEVLAAGEPDLLLVNAHDPALLELART
ncbi:MAG: hypothetical protein QOH89_1906, partial [Pseudonocardiales bacterium]|nr:hypothetical protein [Pseudonocardiales bacterium]